MRLLKKRSTPTMHRSFTEAACGSPCAQNSALSDMSINTGTLTAYNEGVRVEIALSVRQLHNVNVVGIPAMASAQCRDEPASGARSSVNAHLRPSMTPSPYAVMIVEPSGMFSRCRVASCTPHLYSSALLRIIEKLLFLRGFIEAEGVVGQRPINEESSRVPGEREGAFARRNERAMLQNLVRIRRLGQLDHVVGLGLLDLGSAFRLPTDTELDVVAWQSSRR